MLQEIGVLWKPIIDTVVKRYKQLDNDTRVLNLESKNWFVSMWKIYIFHDLCVARINRLLGKHHNIEYKSL